MSIGVEFASVTEGLDLSTPTGRAMAGMLGVFAEFERDTLRERVLAGLAQAKRKGKTLGRPATAKAKADRVQELFAEGLNKRQISKRLHIARSSVLRVLERSENSQAPA